MNTQIAKLLQRHHHALVQKGLDSPTNLLQAVRLDMVKAFRVLMEIYERTAVDIVHQFFADHPTIIPHILPSLDQTYLHHLGFQVHEPHDLILPGFYRWLPRFSDWLGVPLRVNGIRRFPSSAAFQERVGAYTEMMQIWVEKGDRELLIEMFDIYKRHNNEWLPIKQALQFSRWADWCGRAQTHIPLTELLAGDGIWHYGVHVGNTAVVTNLHSNLQQFMADKPQYKMAYNQPVLNLRDTSFHTKILSQKAGLEIEFLTQNLPSRQCEK